MLRNIFQKQATLKSTVVRTALETNPVDCSKFKLYHAFEAGVWRLQPYQALAINRGESKKILRVSLVIPDHTVEYIIRQLTRHWKHRIHHSTSPLPVLSVIVSTGLFSLLQTSIEDAYSRLLKKRQMRETRFLYKVLNC